MLKVFERLGATSDALLNRTRDQYLEEARSYEVDRVRESAASTRTAWRVAGISLTLAFVAVASYPITLAVLLPLKTTEHVPVLISKDTGEVRLPQAITGQPKDFVNALVEGAAYAYVFNRESYLRQTLAQQYGYVKSFSSGDVLTTLNVDWNVNNPQSPKQRYGNSRVEVAKRSVRFQPNNVVVVEFIKTTDAGGANEVKQTLAATLVFELTNKSPMDANDRQHNPFGLYFTAYRLSGITELPQ